MNDYKNIVNKGLEAGYNELDMARKLFLTCPTEAFKDNYDIAFEILNEIAYYFSIPITSIQVAGSSKFGYSYFKEKEFSAGDSDLDIAIINKELFTYYSEVTFKVSKGFSDATKFSSDNLAAYKKYIALGIFRPDKMPTCEEKRDWKKFFNQLSNKYIKHFKNINAGIYLSETFFEHKQFEIISKIKDSNI